MKPIGSVITTSQKAPLSKTGTPGGERGLATQSNSEISDWLAHQTPAAMDEAAVSRASSHGVRLNVKMVGRYPNGPNGETLPAYSVAAGCEIDGTDQQRETALADLRKFSFPPPVRNVEAWLAELSVLTAGRGREGFDAELMINAYSSRLTQYPADVVRFALLVKTWKWFPSWDELEAVCEAKAGPRRHMIAALSKPAPTPDPPRPTPTDEERQRVRAYVAERFPTASQPQQE